MHRTARSITLTWIAAVTVPLTLLGCASTSEREGSVRTVGLTEFASPDSKKQPGGKRDGVSEAEPDHVGTASADLGDGRTPDAAQRDQRAMAGMESLSTEESAQPVWPEQAGSIGAREGVAAPQEERLAELGAAWPDQRVRERIIIDSMVGQVNGRPIFADSFFEPIEDRLMAISQRTTRREFIAHSTEIVREHLREILLNELFLAEAESQLTSEQQQGLFAFMRAMREEEIARGGGARSAADQRLREREGVTVEEYIEASRDIMLLRELQRKKIQPRVIVSWRDIEREYQRLYKEYNKPATAKISRVRLSTEREAELIEEVQQRIAAGEPFSEIARSLGNEDGGAWQEFTMGESGLAGIPLSENLLKHVVNLEVGETSEPFEVGRSTWWLHLAEIDQPRGRSLYDSDVQRELSNYLHNRRFNEEMNKYIHRLMEHGIHDQFNEMHERLVMIAVQRYGP